MYRYRIFLLAAMFVAFAAGASAQKRVVQSEVIVRDGEVTKIERIIENGDTTTIERKQIEDRFRRPDNWREKRMEINRTWVVIGDNAKKKENRWCSKWRERTRGHWAGVSLGYSGLVSSLADFSLPEDARYMTQDAKSIGFTWNVFDVSIVNRPHFVLFTGLGLEWNNFRFAQNVTLRNDDGHIAPNWYYYYNGIDLKKSKLTTGYLNLPLAAEFKFGRGDRGFVNFGAVGGWRFAGHTKIKAHTPALDGKRKDRGDLCLANFHYGATVNVGYSCVALTASYYPQSIFKKGQGPDVQQVNIGIAIIK